VISKWRYDYERRIGNLEGGTGYSLFFITISEHKEKCLNPLKKFGKQDIP
jgi:hypothetical protein